MYIAVDMHALRFLPVGHANVNVLTNLVWLEYPVEDELWLFDAHSPSAFNSMTPYQQSKLYCNTVGADKAPRFGEPLCKLLVDLASRIPVRTDIQTARLEMQCGKVPEGQEGNYLYDATGYSPVRKPDLWAPQPVTLPEAGDIAAVIAAPRAAPPKPAPVVVPPANVAVAQAGAAPAGAKPWEAAPVAAAPAPKPKVILDPAIKKPWEK